MPSNILNNFSKKEQTHRITSRAVEHSSHPLTVIKFQKMGLLNLGVGPPNVYVLHLPWDESWLLVGNRVISKWCITFSRFFQIRNHNEVYPLSEEIWDWTRDLHFSSNQQTQSFFHLKLYAYSFSSHPTVFSHVSKKEFLKSMDITARLPNVRKWKYAQIGVAHFTKTIIPLFMARFFPANHRKKLWLFMLQAIDNRLSLKSLRNIFLAKNLRGFLSFESEKP